MFRSLHWDTHAEWAHHTGANALRKWIDRSPNLILGIWKLRGLLDRTLVIIASEFSRDMP
jgi:hypothetical protein